MKINLILLTIFILLSASLVFAGWTEDMRITDRGSEIYPQIIARNDTLHVAWQQLSGDHLVSYIRSIDGGDTWGELTDLVDDGHFGSRADLSLSNDHVVIGRKDGTTQQPYISNQCYSISTAGDYWPEVEYIYPDGYDGAMAFAFTHSGDSLYSVYLADSRDSTGYLPINFLYSPDLGESWSNEYPIGYTNQTINGMLIKKCGNSLIIVWTGTPYPELASYEAMAVVSGDGGQTWSERIMLSEYGRFDAQLPCLSCNRVTDEIAIGWMDYNYPGDLYIRLSSDGGYTWEPEIHVTDHHSISNPNIEFVGDTLWAVWDDWSFSSQWELGYKKSIDRGQNWCPIERLTYAETESYYPWLSYDNGKLHLVWTDDRPPHGGDEIYYKRWEPDVSITDNSNPNDFSLFYTYPNPFNSSTIITYSNLKGGEIEIYDICGRLVRKLGCGGSKEGPHTLGQQNQGKITWDATDASGEKVSSGVYFARAKSSAGYQIAKMIYLK